MRTIDVSVAWHGLGASQNHGPPYLAQYLHEGQVLHVQSCGRCVCVCVLGGGGGGGLSCLFTVAGDTAAAVMLQHAGLDQ